MKERDEVVLDEFRGEPSLVAFWLYVSSDCEQGKAVELTMSVEDTWVNPKEPARLNFDLMVATMPTLTGVVPRIDGDTPGWSMQNRIDRLDVDSRYELRVDVEMQGADLVQMEHVLPTVDGGIAVRPDAYVSAPMLASSGVFVASDDLDFTTPGLQQGTRWLNSMSRGWAVNPNPRALFAADVSSFRPIGDDQAVRQYSFRQEYLLPFTMEAPRVAPPPKPVVKAPPPKPAAVVPPPPKDTSTVLGVGAAIVRIVETRVVWEEDEFSKELEEDEETSDPQAWMFPAFHLHFGGRVRGQIDGYFGGRSGEQIFLDIAGGPRVNAIHMDRFQMGAFTGVGVRMIQVGLAADAQVVYKAGMAADVFVTQGFVLWGQLSTGTPTGVGEEVGGNVAYSVLPRQLTLGIGGRM